MNVATTVAQARALVDALPRPLGFVPTMGALHAGHLNLIERARSESAAVVASVFVNPLQFEPHEDLDRYPRDLDGDRSKLDELGVDVLFAPSVEEMYPPGFSTSVNVGALGTRFEGAIRPNHFAGVATVVARLLNIVRPDALYIGQKDAQQTAVLRKLVRDLAFPVDVEIVATMREPDGLAMSSRNVYLTAEQRAQAPTLQAALRALYDALHEGETKAQALERARAVLGPLATEDYFDVVDALSFEPIESVRAPAFVVGAARFGTTRLLDNVWA
jgi:pantoate--beta-alanine ligase